MYSYEDRIKAVALYIKLGRKKVAAVCELGYPSTRMLLRWYREFIKDGDLHKKYIHRPRYSQNQKIAAVDYYLTNGRSISATIRALGYPSNVTLMQWIDDLSPGKRKLYFSRGCVVNFSYAQKKDAVLELCTRDVPADDIAVAVGCARESLYKWKREMLDEERKGKRKNKDDLPDDVSALREEAESLKRQIYRLQMEYDILEKATEIIKKGQGIDPRKLTNREKASLIDALRTKYPLNDLLQMLKIAKSSYFYQVQIQKKPEKYSNLREEVKTVFYENQRRYGYRRIHAEIRRRFGMISEKVILGIMNEENLVVIGKKNRKYTSYKGEISPSMENLLDRDFYADIPNAKWVTDLTEFHIPAGKVYLSPMIDCFDGMVVSWTIGTSPDAELVNTMLDDAISNLCLSERPVIH